MFSMTAPRPPACVIASIRRPCDSCRLNKWRRQATALTSSPSSRLDFTSRNRWITRRLPGSNSHRFICDAPVRQNERQAMLVVHVHVRVKPEHVQDFLNATLANARESVKEPGIARFDVLQQQDDPTRFVLIEAYRTSEAPAAHKETKHYQVWRDTVAPLMAEARSSVKFGNVFPNDEKW